MLFLWSRYGGFGSEQVGLLFYLVECCKAKCSVTFANIQYYSLEHTDPGGQEGHHGVYNCIVDCPPIFSPQMLQFNI